MTHSEEKKQGRWDVMCVSQVSVAILYLTSQCSALLQHCHGNDELSFSHKFAPSFLRSALLKKGAALLEVHSWGSQDVNPKGRRKEKSWHWRNGTSGKEMAKGWDEPLGKA